MARINEITQQLVPTLEASAPSPYEAEELTPEEQAEAILQAKKEKYIQRRKREYWEAVTAEREQVKLTKEQLFQVVETHKTAQGKPFVIDNDNRDQIELLCMYFSDDLEFEKRGFNLKKGLMLFGGLGVGKTHLMSLFFQNQKASYAMVQCHYIENKWVNAQKDDLDPIKYYSNNIPIAVNSNPYGHTLIGVCLDDLGTETSPAKRFGEDKNVLAEVLMERYNTVKDFTYTHVTTNLSASALEAKYGDRVRDRMREMFNLISFDFRAKSRRA